VPLCGILAASIVSAADHQTPLAKVELLKQAPKPGLATLPASAPRPVLYYLGGASAPSCGLLPSEPGASIITPILETEPNEIFPNCLEVTDGAMFQYRGVTDYVFRYRQRDTREDVSTVHFFAQRSTAGIQPLYRLNEETAPVNKGIKYLAAWAKFRLISLDDEKESFVTSVSHSIITDSAILSVSRNLTMGSCRTEVDAVTTEATLSSAKAACNAILGSTSLVIGKAIYFIVMFESDGSRPIGQIVVVEGKSVREALELEKRLAAQIGSGKLLKVKESLRKLVQ
jgi:hypothetical protein